MKISISLTFLILAAAAGLCWQLDGQLAVARKDASHLTSETARLGIAAVDSRSPRPSKKIRVDHKAVARQLGDEYIQFIKSTDKGDKLDSAAQARFDECWKRISALDAGSVKILCSDLLAYREFSEKPRLERLVFLLRILLAEKNPHAALEFVMEHYAVLKKTHGFEHVISTALAVMARDNPQAAADWLMKNSAELPTRTMPFYKKAIWCSAAERNPSAAFSVVAGLGLNDMELHSAMHDIVTTARTEEEMTTTLAALREYRKTIESDKILRDAVDQNLGYLSQNFRKVSFETANKWICGANLNSRELDKFCERLSGGIVEDTGKWIEWMGNTLPVEKRASHITDMMQTWTEQDYEAAGKWLASAPDGPTRNAAIRSYAKTVSKHDPETAMQWIMTLPPGNDRDSTLKNIYLNLPKDDPAAKEAFKQKHRIK